MEVARGKYLKFLDDDDRLKPGALLREVKVLRRMGASISYGGVEVRRSGGENYRFLPSERHDLISGLMRGSVWSHPVALTYRREAIQTIRWDPSLAYNQDKDFAIRVASQEVETADVGAIVGEFHDHEGERITTTVKKEVPKVERLERQIAFILKGIERLRERGTLEPYHRRAAAEGLWQWAYMAAPYDLDVLTTTFDRIREIDPDFLPSRRWKGLHLLDRITSPAFTEILLWPMRRLRR
jgi:glycosyltransferase involved in cell wall biosynthesis